MSEIQHKRASETAYLAENLQKPACFVPKDNGNDTREKLLADCEDLIRRIQERYFSGRDETALRYQLADLLDCQAAITERECRRISEPYEDAAARTIGDMRAALEATTKERDKLQARLDDFDGDCYCGATVVQWYEYATRLQDEVDGFEQTHMLLPADADGVPIRLGDMVAEADHAPNGGVVVGMKLYNSQPDWLINCGAWVHAKSCRHVKRDTVESLLEEFGRILVPENAQDGLPEFVELYAERIRKAVEQ